MEIESYLSSNTQFKMSNIQGRGENRMSNPLSLWSAAVTRREAEKVNSTAEDWHHSLAAGCWLYHHEFLEGSFASANSNIALG